MEGGDMKQASYNNYEQAKRNLLALKKEIDNSIDQNGISHNLSKKEYKLISLYEKCLYLSKTDQDKRYVSFNYYPCKSMISLSKKCKYDALEEWLIGFKNLIEYVNQIQKPDKWDKSLVYYKSRLDFIRKRGIDFFGNIKDEQIDKILDFFLD